MTGRLLSGALVAGLLGVAACGPGTAPAGQPPMITISDQTLEAVRQEFNRTVGETRVVLLLSPT